MDALYSAVAALAMASPFLAILLILAYYYFFCVPRRRKRKKRKTQARRFPLRDLEPFFLVSTLIYRPRIQFAVEAQHRQVEDADEDDNGDPDTPTRHLHASIAPYPPGRSGRKPHRAAEMSSPQSIYDTIEEEVEHVWTSK